MTDVRPATIDDVPELVMLGELMHAESPRFSRFPYLPEKVAGLAQAMLGSESSLILVAQQPGAGIVGMFAGFVAEHYFSSAKYASDVVVFVAPAFRGSSAYPRMLKAFETWAIERGAVELTPGVSAEIHPERILEMYERFGYARSGYLVVKHVQP